LEDARRETVASDAGDELQTHRLLRGYPAKFHPVEDTPRSYAQSSCKLALRPCDGNRFAQSALGASFVFNADRAAPDTPEQPFLFVRVVLVHLVDHLLWPLLVI
jgi:hypothetical protein